MKKEKLPENLKAYLDQQLSAEEAIAVEKLLAEEPALQEEAKAFKRISSSLRAFNRGPDVSPEAVERTVGVAVASQRMRKGRSPWVLAWAAAFVLVMVGSLLVPRMVGGVFRHRVSQGADTTMDSGVAVELSYPSISSRSVERKVAVPETESKEALVFEPVHVSQRYIIRRASVHLRVENVAEAERRVRSLLSVWGGFVESSSEEFEDGRRAGITMLLRVPEARFEDALNELDKLGVRTRRQTGGEDVTTQVVDYEARLKNLRAEEEAYRQIMRSARRVVDILEVQERLSRVRGEIESLEGQLRTLKRLAALSTIELTLEERPRGSADGDPNWAVDTWRRATMALVAVFRNIAVATIWVFVYTPIWLPLAFLGILVWRLSRR
ncbi:MAG: DUF4349 domain-containing protein [Candidatus Caldarchaeum sp.]